MICRFAVRQVFFMRSIMVFVAGGSHEHTKKRGMGATHAALDLCSDVSVVRLLASLRFQQGVQASSRNRGESPPGGTSRRR